MEENMRNTNDFVIKNGVLKEYIGPGGEVVIPKGVTRIGEKAFFRCKTVTSVTIPDGVTDIDREAFVLCKNLKTVTIPESVVRFGKNAFGWCANLSAMRIPRSLKTISEEAFIYCDKLTEVEIPEGVENIEKGAFAICTSLQSISLPGSVSIVGKDAFPHVKYLKLKRWIKGLSQAVHPGTLREIEIEDPGNVPAQYKTLIVHKEARDDSDSLHDFSIKDGVLTDYKGNGAEVVIPADVTEIGCGAFQHASNLISVIIPEGVSRISESAFADCGKLNHLVLPKSLVSIGDMAFQQCDSLIEVIIPDNVAAIGHLAFFSCRRLKNIVIPDSVRNIGNSAFGSCGSLTDVVIPEGVQKIGSNVFQGCKNLKSITIPESAKDLGMTMFKSCSCVVKCRHFSPQLAGAMKDCDDFNTFLLLYTEDNISEIPMHLRRRALLGFVKENTEDMNSDRAKSYLNYARKNSGKMIDLAFKYPKLLSFLVENQLIKAADIESYVAEAEKTGNTEQKALLLDYQNRIGPEKVKKVREKKNKIQEKFLCEFSERMTNRDPSDGIAGITFTVTGKLWPWKSKDEIKEYLESYGASLSNSVNNKTDYLVISDPKSQSEKTKKAKALGVQILSEADFNDLVGKRYKDAAHVSVPKWIRSIPEEAFVRCRSMSEVSIPIGIMTIGEKAFEGCKSLKNVELPEGLTEIGEKAFHNCVGIESLTLPASITRIGKGAFAECRDISFSFGTPELCVLVLESSFKFTDNGSLLEYTGPGGKVVIPEGVTEFVSSPFYPSYGSQSQITSITLPNSMTVIPQMAFSGCSKLEHVSIPEGVTRIEKAAFSGCGKLSEITLPASLTELGEQAFFWCKSLKSIVLPEGIAVVGDGAFKMCSGLTEIIIPKSVVEIGKLAFSGCDSLTIHAPEGSYAEYYAKENNIPFAAEYLAEAEKPGTVEGKAALLQYQSELGQEMPIKTHTEKEKKEQHYTEALAEQLVNREPPKGIEGLHFAIPTVPLWWKNRKHLKEFLEYYGAKLSTTVSKTTDYLVLNEKEEVPARAKELGVPVLSTTAFNEMVGEHFQNAEVIAVPEWLKEIPGTAFTMCKDLVKVQLPRGLVSINDGAFRRNQKLKEIEIPESVTSIGEGAFEKCESLVQLAIPEGVVTIGDDGFLNCSSLERVKLPKSLRVIGSRAFSGCPKLTLYVPAGSFSENYAKENNIRFVTE